MHKDMKSEKPWPMRMSKYENSKNFAVWEAIFFYPFYKFIVILKIFPKLVSGVFRKPS